MCWNLFKVSFFFTDCLNSLIISEFWASVIVYFLGRWISFKKMIQSFFKDKKKFFCFENANYRFNLIWFATISSTIEGSAKVLTSLNSSGRLAATFCKILCIILPERVFMQTRTNLQLFWNSKSGNVFLHRFINYFWVLRIFRDFENGKYTCSSLVF